MNTRFLKHLSKVRCFTVVSKAYARKIENCAKSLGAVLVGFADLSLIREGWLPRFPENLLDMFPYGVSIAVKLPDPVIDMIALESRGPSMAMSIEQLMHCSTILLWPSLV